MIYGCDTPFPFSFLKNYLVTFWILLRHGMFDNYIFTQYKVYVLKTQ